MTIVVVRVLEVKELTLSGPLWHNRDRISAEVVALKQGLLLLPAAAATRWRRRLQLDGDVERSGPGLGFGQEPHNMPLDARSFIEIPVHYAGRNDHERVGRHLMSPDLAIRA
jgi:hypothetical protein